MTTLVSKISFQFQRIYNTFDGHCLIISRYFLPVHLRVRPINILCPKTVFPSTSAIVYWQVEPVGASYSGEWLHACEQLKDRLLWFWAILQYSH